MVYFLVILKIVGHQLIMPGCEEPGNQLRDVLPPQLFRSVPESLVDLVARESDRPEALHISADRQDVLQLVEGDFFLQLDLGVPGVVLHGLQHGCPAVVLDDAADEDDAFLLVDLEVDHDGGVQTQVLSDESLERLQHLEALLDVLETVPELDLGLEQFLLDRALSQENLPELFVDLDKSLDLLDELRAQILKP